MAKIPYKQTNITLDRTRKNRKFQIIDYVLTFFFFLFLAVLTTIKIFGDDDIFWHLATGRFIFENGYIPSQEIFGFITAGIKWIPFEWGWEVLTFIIYKIGGFLLLSIFRTLIILSTFYTLFFYLKRIKIEVTFIIIISIAVVIATLPRFSIRPQIIYYMFLAILIVRIWA